MTRDELLEKLESVEWDDIEFKEAAWNVPKNALETVSAFANTSGGHIVFGVSEGDGAMTITGVTDVDRVQGEFLGQTRDANKISVVLPVTGRPHKFPEGTLLCFHIPEASRNQKPVFLDQNLRKAFIRRGSGNYHCTSDELMRFIRDAGGTPYDSETLDLDPTTFFDASSLRWYRALFQERNPGQDPTVDDETFLCNWGFLVEKDGKLLPTRAAVLVFGAAQYVRQQFPRIIVDLQFYPHSAGEFSPETRWADRVTVEENLVVAWRKIVDFFQRHSDRPFSIDLATLRRHDDPPDYISFREAIVNLLIHQDFGDATRNPVVRLFRDGMEFFNPGDALASREQLLQPGDKDVRNPKIVRAFRQIGLSEQAGTGMGAIFTNWRRLEYLPPEIDNDRAEKSFRLRLRREPLRRSEEQVMAEAKLGARLSKDEAAVFAFLIRKGEADLTDIWAVTGLSGPDASELVRRLTIQVILRPTSDSGEKFVLADHLRELFPRGIPGKSSEIKGFDDVSVDEKSTGQATEQVGHGTDQVTRQVTEQVGEKPADRAVPARKLSDAQWVIVRHADAPRSFAKLMKIAGYTGRQHFKNKHLNPLISRGILRMTVPDKPTSPKQEYVLTQAGLSLKELYLERDPQKPDEEGAE